jgi:hypothetical protein
MPQTSPQIAAPPDPGPHLRSARQLVPSLSARNRHNRRQVSGHATAGKWQRSSTFLQKE